MTTQADMLEAAEFKELALEMTDAQNASEDGIQHLVEVLKENPLWVLCGGRMSGKTTLLAAIARSLQGDLYYLDEDSAPSTQRILQMRDRARHFSRISIACLTINHIGAQDGLSVHDLVYLPMEHDVYNYADAVVYVNRTSWRVIKNRIGSLIQGDYDRHELLGNGAAYDAVCRRSQMKHNTDRLTLQSERSFLLATGMETVQKPIYDAIGAVAPRP